MADRLHTLTIAPYRRSFGPGLPHGVRQGFELLLRSVDGSVGLGEAAPLLDFGSETWADAERSLEQAQEQLQIARLPIPEQVADIPVILESLSLRRDRTPASYAGLELALLDLLARIQGRPLASLLLPEPGGGAPDQRRAVPLSASVRVNAMISGSDPERALARGVEAIADGYTALKVKVGALSVSAAADLLTRLREAIGPETLLRADANRSWSQADARRALGLLADLGLDYLEEPCTHLEAFLLELAPSGCAGSDLRGGYMAPTDAASPPPLTGGRQIRNRSAEGNTPPSQTRPPLMASCYGDELERWLSLSKEEVIHRAAGGTGVRLAADESACPADRAWRWLGQPVRPAVFILKPLLFGGLLEARGFAAAAVASGARIVVTSGLEGPIGLAAALHLAAALPGVREPAGLATAQLQESQGADPLPDWLIPHKGLLSLPAEPGLGIRVPTLAPPMVL